MKTRRMEHDESPTDSFKPTVHSHVPATPRNHRAPHLRLLPKVEHLRQRYVDGTLFLNSRVVAQHLLLQLLAD